MALAIGLLLAMAAPAPAQERVAAPAEEEEVSPAEAEFVGSTMFQSAMAAVRLGSPLFLDTHFFGVDTNEIGIVGLTWELRHKALRLLPGLGWSFGSENRPALVATARWSFENEKWISQGLWAVSLRAHVPDAGAEHGEESEAVTHSSVLDGVHVSRRIRQFDVGPLVEHLRYREENEWKAGGRVAWGFGHGIKIVSQLVAPDPEFRLGLAWEP